MRSGPAPPRPAPPPAAAQNSAEPTRLVPPLPRQGEGAGACVRKGAGPAPRGGATGRKPEGEIFDRIAIFWGWAGLEGELRKGRGRSRRGGATETATWRGAGGVEG